MFNQSDNLAMVLVVLLLQIECKGYELIQS